MQFPIIQTLLYRKIGAIPLGKTPLFFSDNNNSYHICQDIFHLYVAKKKKSIYNEIVANIDIS